MPTNSERTAYVVRLTDAVVGAAKIGLTRGDVDLAVAAARVPGARGLVAETVTTADERGTFRGELAAAERGDLVCDAVRAFDAEHSHPEPHAAARGGVYGVLDVAERIVGLPSERLVEHAAVIALVEQLLVRVAAAEGV